MQSVSKTTVETSFFKEVLDMIGSFQTLQSILLVVCGLGVFFLCLFMFKRNINKISKQTIRSFINVKKYLPKTYIELNNNMENLRYFIFSRWWKKRVVSQYNILFNGYNGKLLKKHLSEELTMHISYFTSMSKLKEELSKTKKIFLQLNKEKQEYRKKMGDEFYVIRNFTYSHVDYITRLEKYCEIIENKVLLLIGSAGNGKTSLLCKTAEMAMSNNRACLFLNARDIDGNCLDYVISKMPLPLKTTKYHKLFIFFINILLWLKKKNFYIIIDAINENDSSNFKSSLAELCNFFNRFSNIKLIFSCRSEYFSCRYEKLFDECSKKPMILDLMQEVYADRASEKLLKKYSNFYNVHGIISINMKEKLFKSLLLMRIFFEVNQNQGLNNLEFRNAEIYKKYITKIETENPGVEVNRIINEIAAKMVEKRSYDSVDILELTIPIEERELFLKLLDNNLIINRTIVSGTGITEREKELIYFVFDEFRDFCLARYLLVKDEDENENEEQNEYSNFFSEIDELYRDKLSPLEGVLKYGYYYFKTSQQYGECQKILSLYGKNKISQMNQKPLFENRQSDFFDDFGLSLVFMAGEELLDFEYQYVAEAIHTSRNNLHSIFVFLLKNEITKSVPAFELFINFIIKEENYAIISDFFNNLFDEEYDYSNFVYVKEFDACRKVINKIYENYGSLSDSLKNFIILSSSYDEFAFTDEEQEKYPITEEDISALINMIQNDQLKEKVENFKELKFPSYHDTDFLKNFMNHFKEDDIYGN